MSDRTLVDAYIKELEAEYTSTRKCLERIPVTLFGYKPHPTSMELGYLTLLVAEIPLWITFMVEQGEVDFATYKRFEFTTSEEPAISRASARGLMIDNFGSERPIAGASAIVSPI